MRVGDSDFTLAGLFSLPQSQWASWTRERGLWGTLRQTCLGLEIGPNLISRVSSQRARISQEILQIAFGFPSN